MGPVEAIEGAPTIAPTDDPTPNPSNSPSDTPTGSPTDEVQSMGPTTRTPSVAPTSADYWGLPELIFIGDDGGLGGLPLGLCQGKRHFIVITH